jgi:hypothetical protein
MALTRMKKVYSRLTESYWSLIVSFFRLWVSLQSSTKWFKTASLMVIDTWQKNIALAADASQAYSVSSHLFVFAHLCYSLRPILLFANTDVSTTKMCLDTYILAKSNMDRREYLHLQVQCDLSIIYVLVRLLILYSHTHVVPSSVIMFP